MALKRKLTDEFLDDCRPIKTRPSIHGIKEPADDDSTSSVGSNNPIYDLVVISDDDEDEAESPPFKFDDDNDDDDAVKSPPTTVDGVTGDRWRETELTKEKVEEEEEEEGGDWWVKYGSMIVDDNGFLLGEFRRLDEDLYMNIMMIH